MRSKALAWVRGGLLALFVMACAVALLWNYSPKHIHKLDQWVLKSYSNYYQKQFDTIMALKAESEMVALQELEYFLVDIEGIKKGDRIAPLKRRALQELVALYKKKGALKKALSWSDIYLQFDERDLKAAIERGKLLMAMPDRKEEGEKVIVDLYKKVPEVLWVSDAYADVLLGSGERLKALSVYMKPRTKETLSKGWQLFWDTGKGFNAGQKADITPEWGKGNEFSFSISLPKGIKELRLDPPAYQPLIMHNPRISALFPEGKRNIDLLKLNLTFNQMKRVNGGVESRDFHDPYFFWKLPASFTHKRFRMTFSSKNYLEIPERYKQVARTVSQSGGVFQSLGLLKRNTAGLTEGVFQIYWRNKKGNYSEQSRQNVPFSRWGEASLSRFDLNVNINQPVSHLRLDLPEKMGVSYTIHALVLKTDAGLTSVDLNKMKLVHVHNIKRIGNRMIVTGSDPYFGILVSEDNLFVKSVHVSGLIK